MAAPAAAWLCTSLPRSPSGRPQLCARDSGSSGALRRLCARPADALGHAWIGADTPAACPPGRARRSLSHAGGTGCSDSNCSCVSSVTHCSFHLRPQGKGWGHRALTFVPTPGRTVPDVGAGARAIGQCCREGRLSGVKPGSCWMSTYCAPGIVPSMTPVVTPNPRSPAGRCSSLPSGGG